MKKYSRLLFGCILCAFIAAFAAPPSDQGYALVWSDEFDSQALDTNNWSFEVGGLIMGRETAYFSNGPNLTFENGAAVLWIKKETYSAWSYTSCRVNTKGKKEFKYGYMEVRLKAPSGGGLMSTFWTTGSDINVSGWPACGEIDLYAQRTGQQLYSGTPGDNCFFAACYCKGASGGTSAYGKQNNYTECLCNDYHLYAIEWDSISIKYFFDGNEFFEFDTINASFNFVSFHQPHFISTDIDLYVGSSLDNGIFPQAMSVDYVRVYQRDAVRVQKNIRKNTRMSFELVDPAKAQLKVYDLKGRVICDYTDTMRRMKYSGDVITIISSDLPIGIYMLRLTEGQKSLFKKLVVTK